MQCNALNVRVKSYEPSGPRLPELIPVSVDEATRPLLLLLDGMQVYHRYPPAFRQVSLTVRWYPLLLLGERGTVRVKCLAQENNAMPRLGLKPRPLDPESSALTTRPPHLQLNKTTAKQVWLYFTRRTTPCYAAEIRGHYHESSDCVEYQKFPT